MDLSTFKNDEEIVQYLEAQLDKINTLNECRLFREEQMQLSEKILNFRNCIEWIIRSNQVITNIKYALTKCLKYAVNMASPLEETENKKLYSYPNCENMVDVAYYLIDECGSLGEIPDRLKNYIDYEAYARDLDIEGYFVETRYGIFECLY